MKKIILGLAVAAMAASVSAFTDADFVKSKFASSTWIFNGDENEILDADHYFQGIPEPDGCGLLSDELPCKVNFPSNIDNKPALESYLQDLSRVEDDVMALAETTRKANP